MRPGFYFVRVRVPEFYIGWLPLEVEVGERTVRVTAGFSVAPRRDEAGAYRYLLRRNARPRGACFALAPDGRPVLVASLPVGGLDAAALDALVGRMVETAVECAGSYASIAFGRRRAGRGLAGDDRRTAPGGPGGTGGLQGATGDDR